MLITRANGNKELVENQIIMIFPSLRKSCLLLEQTVRKSYYLTSIYGGKEEKGTIGHGRSYMG
jgi:hypothetical protein